jgi:gamma-glutamyltranspeptidase/glutathione hydrolase
VEYGTSHLSIVDRDGNAVSMTMSVERLRGTHYRWRLRAEQPADRFLVRAGTQWGQGGQPAAAGQATEIFNVAQPDPEPDGSLFAAVGSPGGSRIIGYTVRAILGLTDWNLTMQQAVSLPHVINRNNYTELEDMGEANGLDLRLYQFSKLAAPLADMGHEVRVRDLTSGLQGVRLMPGGKLDGGADPRREGVVIAVD